MKTKAASAIILLVVSILSSLILGIPAISPVRAETVDEVGTYFEITNSTYLNITLTSTEVVRVLLESVPRMVCFLIESNGSETTTDLTFTGFEPDTTYYRYQDGYFTEDFTTNSSGRFTYTQDISEPHHTFIQEDRSTIYITSDFTFTKNLNDSIVVGANNIVIDGNGYALEGSGYGMGFYLWRKSGVTIKNVVVNNWTYGIRLSYSRSNNISGNTITNNGMYGIGLTGSFYNGISGNIVSNNGKGIEIDSMSWETVINGNMISNNVEGIYFCSYLCNICCNTITNNGKGVFIRVTSHNNICCNTISNNIDGIYMVHSGFFTVDSNRIANNTRGILLTDECRHNIISNNVLSMNSYGICFERVDYNSVYHNSFINNERQAFCSLSFNNKWDDGYPSGGNYWSDYTGVDEYNGANQDQPGSDGIGDTAHLIGGGNVDHYPLMRQRAAITSLQNERAVIESWHLAHGFEKQLTSKIDDAIGLIEMGNLNGAKHKLGDLIKKVTNDAMHLTQEQKDYVIQATQGAIELIG